MPFLYFSLDAFTQHCQENESDHLELEWVVRDAFLSWYLIFCWNYSGNIWALLFLTVSIINSCLTLSHYSCAFHDLIPWFALIVLILQCQQLSNKNIFSWIKKDKWCDVFHFHFIYLTLQTLNERHQNLQKNIKLNQLQGNSPLADNRVSLWASA